MRLGQHFLKTKNIVNKIIETAEIKPTDVVLEVGPGNGVLTEELIKKAKRVIAVEKDKDLVNYLEEKFKDCENLKLIHDDILKIDHWKLIENCKLKIENYKVVANIPYYITSRFLRNFLQTEHQPSMMVLMLQKEVAERILGKKPAVAKAMAGKESILSISVKAYGTPKIIKTVPAGHFSPQPKVDSAIIKIDSISKKFFKRNRISFDEKGFFDMVKKGFGQKRKMLKNNLKISSEILKKHGLSEKVRAEELSLEDWKNLYKHL